MLIRISLIIAIVAGLAATGLNFVKVREKITTLVTERNNERAAKDQALADLATTRSELSSTQTELAQTKQALETTSAERDKAVNLASQMSRKNSQLTEELNETRAARDTAQTELAAYKNTGLTPPQILTLSGSLKKAEAELAEAKVVITWKDSEIKRKEAELARYRPDKHIVYLPAHLKGQVIVSDPKWDFVVLNVGEDQGILQDGELLVNRNGQLVAKVKVTSVHKERSIANVLPGWKLGEVLEGDQVIPAHPSS